jgi:hypothetical protein
LWPPALHKTCHPQNENYKYDVTYTNLAMILSITSLETPSESRKNAYFAGFHCIQWKMQKSRRLTNNKKEIRIFRISRYIISRNITTYNNNKLQYYTIFKNQFTDRK